MNKEEIIQMLRASCDKDKVDPEHNGFWVIITEELETFAKLAAEKEREACIAHAMTSAEKAINIAIKLEREACAKFFDDNDTLMFWGSQAAREIRARGQE